VRANINKYNMDVAGAAPYTGGLWDKQARGDRGQCDNDIDVGPGKKTTKQKQKGVAELTLSISHGEERRRL
jgi:hypothetical protein